jgi:hypothetical protein
MSRSQALERIRTLSAQRPAADLSEVANVVCVMSSSRGGSSVFMEMLRHHPGLLHLHGEINPALALAGLLYPESGTGSDALDASHATPAAQSIIHRTLAQEAGHPVPWTDTIEAREALSTELCWRLSAQWPLVHFALSTVRDAVNQALSAAPVSDHGTQTQRFHARLLLAIRAVHPQVNPWYYDLDPELVSAWFPDLTPPLGPPSELVIEEPPFVLTGPWAHADAKAHATQPFVFKTPGHAYRIPFLRALYPKDPNETLRIRFEDIIGDNREQTFSDICRWLNVPMAPALAQIVAAGLPPVMATARPRQRRWFSRADMIGPVLDTPEVAQTAQALGYLDRSEWV